MWPTKIGPEALLTPRPEYPDVLQPRRKIYPLPMGVFSQTCKQRAGSNKEIGCVRLLASPQTEDRTNGPFGILTMAGHERA